jgi:hypothetical protein
MYTTTALLMTKVGAVVGDLTVTSRQWAAGAEPAPALGLEPGTADWYNAIGLPQEVVLTEDGHPANTHGWCACDGDAGWVRYERHTPAGRAAHGYVHAACRLLLQVG